MVKRETVLTHLSRIPDEAMGEILDFIDFLAERRGYAAREDSLQRLHVCYSLNFQAGKSA